MAHLAKLTDITVKLHSDGGDGLPRATLLSTLKIAAVHRKPGSKSVVYLQTVSGDVVAIDAARHTVSMKKAGTGAEVAIDASATAEQGVDVTQSYFGGSLMTSGSFTMMASTQLFDPIGWAR